jgi:hypothetical protein
VIWFEFAGSTSLPVVADHRKDNHAKRPPQSGGLFAFEKTSIESTLARPTQVGLTILESLLANLSRAGLRS